MGLTLRNGVPITVPYTPAAGDIAAGAVIAGVAAGIGCSVATCGMANNVSGGSRAIGGGIYEGTMLSNYAVDTLIYYDPATDKFTNSATNTYRFGFVTTAAASANTAGQAYHHPFVDALV